MSDRYRSRIKLTIVTNDPARALMGVLACSEADRPDWCAVITEPDLIDRLPDGIRAIGIWFSGRYRSKAERAWRDRRCFGGILGLSAEDYAWIEGWIARRDRAERALAFAHLPDRIDRPPADTETAAPEGALARVPQDFRAMAFSQRWV